MVPRACVALLLLGCVYSRFYVLADEGHLFYDDVGNEVLLPIFEEDVPADVCREPKTPDKGEMICGKVETNPDSYICRANCLGGFEFPNKKKRGKLICSFSSNKWEPKAIFPDCVKEIICKPSCKNGGTCTAENVCTCPPRYTGKSCEQDKCKDPPNVPYGSISCKNSAPDTYVCEADCDEGFLFPNNKQKEIHSCDLKTGNWQPKYGFPACGRVCTPPCQNGGTCREENKCYCSPKFIGDSCETEICRDPPEPSNGKIRCSLLLADKSRYACAAECLVGYLFVEKTENHYCDMKTGDWTPAYEFPNCEAVCEPKCQNGGTCVVGNNCTCSPAFHGDRCDKEKCNPPCQNGGTCTDGNICQCPAQFAGKRCQYDKCAQPEFPLNGKVSCEKDSQFAIRCQAECNQGYEFPGGEKKTSHMCDQRTGEWTPENVFPNCQPTCTPRCQNGGSCAEENYCSCAPEFTGDRCQSEGSSPTF